MKSLENRVIVVSGGSSGIGAEVCRLAFEAGARAVYALSRSGSAPLPQVIGVKADVRNSEDMQAVAKKIADSEGMIDYLVLAAGNGIAGAIEETSVNEARYQFDTCFFGLHNTIRSFLPYMRMYGNGKIVTIASVASLVPIPYQAFYSAAKAAVLQYTDALSIELKPFGIQCCCVLPGDTRTGFTSARKFADEATPESPYADKRSKSVAKMEKDEQNGMSPEVIASAVIRQLGRNRRRMSVHVIPGAGYKAIAFLLRILPPRLVSMIVGRLY